MATATHYTPDAGVMSSQIITYSVATALLVCRLISRRLTHVALWWDDFFAMLSWVSCTYPSVGIHLLIFLSQDLCLSLLWLHDLLYVYDHLQTHRSCQVTSC
jgi:hypothetical protein